MTGSDERSADVSREALTRRQVLASGAGASLALFVLGCDIGGGDDDGTKGTSGKVVSGGIFRMGIDYPVASINPFTQSYSLFTFVYPAMTKLGFNGEVVGWLAEGWDKSSDARTWTFKLKEGEWSDGTPLTGDDVVWTANTVLETGLFASGLNTALDGVESMDAPDPRTVVVKLKQPRSDIPFRFNGMFVLPKHVYEKHANGKGGKGLTAFRPEDNLPAVSAGPFTFTKFEEKGTSILSPTPNTFLGKPTLEGAGAVYFENEDAMARALLQGDIEMMKVASGRLADQIEKTDGFVVKARPGDSLRGLVFNSNPKKTTRRELADPTVRQAVSLAMNRDRLVEVVYGGRGRVLRGIIGPAQRQWENPDRPAPVYDPEKANQLLDEAGYKRGSDGVRRNREGQPMSYDLPGHNSYPTRLFDLVATDAEAIGIELRPQRSDYAAWVERIGRNDYLDFDITLAGESSAVSTDEYHFRAHTCGAIKSGLSHSGFCNPKYDKLYAQQQREADPDKRRDIVWQMERILVDDYMVWVPLVVPDTVYAYSDKWAGISTWNYYSWPLTDSLPSVHLTAT